MSADTSQQTVCAFLTQFLYDLIDFETHIKQATWVIAACQKDALSLHMRLVRVELGCLIEDLALHAIKLGCYSNGTARWVAAGSNLRDYPAYADELTDHIHALSLDYQWLIDTSAQNTETAGRNGDQTSSQLFDTINHTLARQILQFDTLTDDAYPKGDSYEKH